MKLSNKEKQELKNNYGEWAIVTGATSGIGRELTLHLASAGFNLVLISRSLNDLQEFEIYLKKHESIDVRIIATDVSDESGIDKIIEGCSDLNVGLLIASAGFGTSGKFIDSDLNTEINMLRVNCEALLHLCHHFSKKFVRQKRGGIILLSSMLAFQGTPYSANYGATKAYVLALAEALAIELKPHGVDVLAAVPGPVESRFSARANMKMSMFMKPAQVGLPILRALGCKSVILPGFLTKFLVYSLRFLPRQVRVKIMGVIMGGMTSHQRSNV